MNTNARPRVPEGVEPVLQRRFYQAVIFLYAVTTACITNRQPVPSELAWHPDFSLNTTFKDFVNTLCQFCDVKLGGDSVTAFTVLDLQHRIQYRFACNRRNKSQLERSRDFVTDLLRTLQSVTIAGTDQRTRLLRTVLRFCRSRVHSYLLYLQKASRACMGTKPEQAVLRHQLRDLDEAAGHADFGALDEATC